MSKKTELRADLNRIGYQLGGAHLTQEARRATFSTFAQAMREKGYGIQSAEQIGGKHLQAFVECRAGARSQQPDDRQRDEPRAGSARSLRQGRIGPQSCVQQQGAGDRTR